MQIDRPNISGTLADTVRQMIVDGRLPAGSRVNEVHLSRALGVSRTPLREALMRLTTEGALTVKPRLGFHVTPLSEEELADIYPVRALLDPEALRLAGKPSAEQLARLTALNQKIARAKAPAAVIALDDEFHLALLERCPNRALLALIEQFQYRTRRYELALMRERVNVLDTVKQHAVVLARLRRGDLRGACAALRKNMESGRAPIEAWLRQRETK
jgi:DNA-binding GntR family transcriptional regulator